MNSKDRAPLGFMIVIHERLVKNYRDSGESEESLALQSKALLERYGWNPDKFYELYVKASGIKQFVQWLSLQGYTIADSNHPQDTSVIASEFILSLDS